MADHLVFVRILFRFKLVVNPENFEFFVSLPYTTTKMTWVAFRVFTSMCNVVQPEQVCNFLCYVEVAELFYFG
ncbi:hypothetical protein ESCOCK376M_23070 [Escherichia coli]|uniref:Uncharacterized protein n=1 Tax=Escherichia coli TaxID=562 RepID=A0A0K6A2T0_ECOLX|nr:hypothetical protein ECENVIRA811_4507 [Escherichia coli Envira 8/11]ERB01197.1 hypothetical protein G879_03806 [Escherichia coli KOEGE 7 (16a)]KDO88673.1 hypothetical protein DO98_05375 [Escherichia coli]MCH6726699.1 hypothetical protein [Escherichia coli]CAK0737474.1 hypothetical protein FGAF200_39690 [Escherichia coli]